MDSLLEILSLSLYGILMKKNNLLLKSVFLTNVLKLVGGTAIAQALSILASPIITRMYGPEAFGLSALFASLTGIIAVVASLRYEMAIMLPEKNRDAANLMALSLILASAMSCMTALVFGFCGDAVASLLKVSELESYLWMVPISVFLSGLFFVLNYWKSRTKNFGNISIAKVAASVATTGTQLGAGFAGYPTGGSLIGAGLLGSTVSIVVLGRKILQDDGKIFRESINSKEILLALKRYKNFPLLDSWAALLNTVSWQLPIFLLSSFFSSTVVGYYSLGLMVLQMPMSLIGSAIGQVFFQEAAEAKILSKEKLTKIVESTFFYLCIIGLFPILLLSLTGNEIFIIIFGLKWAEAGIFAQILAIWIFFWFIYSPTSTLFSIFEVQGNYLIFNVILIITRSLALYIGGFSGNARIALALFSILGMIVYAGATFWILSKSNVLIKNIVEKMLPHIVLSIALLGVIAYAKWYLILGPEWIVVLSCITLLSYYLLAFRNRISEKITYGV
jgi:O-antigen/teichoic acid export membrane protein